MPDPRPIGVRQASLDTDRHVSGVRSEFKDIYICSTWECVGDQKSGTDKRSVKYRPPDTQGEEDYTMNRLYLADRKMKIDR